MTRTITADHEAAELLAAQDGAIARRQAAALGLDTERIRNRARGGRWQHEYRGVYLAFSGTASREATLWAALLRAGPDAVLSHNTAAERHGLIDDLSELIHVMVPASRHPARHAKIPGVVIHRSISIERTRHPVMLPPCTRVEDTVLDLTQVARTFDDAFVWLCRAVGRRRTTSERLLASLAERKKVRWRADICVALGDINEGIMSLLERRYVYGVERLHGLPAASRQTCIRQETGNRYLDNLYEPHAVCVELDGTAAHPADEQWRDKRRDNWNLVNEDLLTLRFGWTDVNARPCETARDVAILLRRGGWRGQFRPCPRCPPTPLP